MILHWKCLLANLCILSDLLEVIHFSLLFFLVFHHVSSSLS
jgi:hypothetical protein